MYQHLNKEHPEAYRGLIRFAQLCRVPGGKTHAGHIATLLAIASAEGSTVSELARGMDGLLMTVSRRIQKLKLPPPGAPKGAEGYVYVTQGADARERHVWLTARGREWIAEAIATLDIEDERWDTLQEDVSLDRC